MIKILYYYRFELCDNYFPKVLIYDASGTLCDKDFINYLYFNIEKDL